MSRSTPGSRSAEDPTVAPVRDHLKPTGVESGAEDRSLEEAVEYVLADCAFAVGQTVGMRTTVDYDAIVCWHDHFRAKFLAAMQRHGDRWLQDRHNVTGVGWMLGERAVRHAAGRPSIDVDAARRAAADVERYCQARAKRAVRAGDHHDTGAAPRLAGYWCTNFPY